NSRPMIITSMVLPAFIFRFGGFAPEWLQAAWLLRLSFPSGACSRWRRQPVAGVAEYFLIAVADINARIDQFFLRERPVLIPSSHYSLEILVKSTAKAVFRM